MQLSCRTLIGIAALSGALSLSAALAVADPIEAEAPLDGAPKAEAPPRPAVPANTEQALAKWLRRNPSAVAGGISILVVLGYYTLAWLLVGRDPAREPTGVLFEPPPGVSPAAARYLTRLGYDRRCLTASLLSLAVKGAIAVEQSGDECTLHKTDGNKHPLSRDERGVLGALFGRSRESVALKEDGRKLVMKASQSLVQRLRLDVQTRLLVANRKALGGGLVLSAVAVLATLLAGPLDRAMVTAFMCVWLSGWTLGVLLLVLVAAAAWWTALRGPERGRSLAAAIVMTLFAVPFAIGEVVGISMLVSHGTPVVVAVILLLATMALVFHFALKARTQEGRALADQLDGFRRYLAGDSEDALIVIRTGAKTPELFERHLPYAFALDVERQWAAQFPQVTLPASRGGHGWSGVLTWYVRDSHLVEPTTIVESLTSALTPRAARPTVRVGSAASWSDDPS